MTSRTKLFVSLLVALAGVSVIAWVYSRRENPVVPSSFKDEARASAEADAKRLAELEAKRLAVAGGAGNAKGGGLGPDGSIQAPPGYGSLKGQTPTTPQQKAAVEAFQTKTHPEYLSCAVLPPKFDRSKWSDSAYREEYLRVPSPGRCYESASAGKDVQQIALMVPAYIETLQNQPVTLSVKATPSMPVTFTSFDAAHFTAGSGEGVVGSLLTTQTVVAGADGIASATMVAPPGVAQNCRVRASCPAASGFVTFDVFVKMPSLAKPVASAN